MTNLLDAYGRPLPRRAAGFHAEKMARQQQTVTPADAVGATADIGDNWDSACLGFCYAGEDDDLGGSKPSDPDDGASDDE